MIPRHIRQLRESQVAPTNITPFRGHSHFWQRARSRRNFLQSAAILGAGAGFVQKSVGASSREGAPRPIPGGIQPFGPGTELFHVFPIAPGFELSTITDFNGVVGGAQVDGTWSGGSVSGSPLIFDTDMRFMSGEYVGQDGKHYHGAFVFVWIDLYVGVPDFNNFSNQVHDFDLGIGSDGLFWTAPLGSNTLTVDPGSGVASLIVTDISALDYFSIPGAFSRGPSAPASVSFQMHWASGNNRQRVRDTVNGFDADFVLNTATMAWTATSGGFVYQSAPEHTSFSLFAEIGHERNGVFFPQGG